MHTTPASLLEQLRDFGQERAWNRFVELYSPMLFTWAQRTGLAQEDTADLVQDVFAVLVRMLPDFVYDPGKSFRAWLKTILLNRYRECCRRKQAVSHDAAFMAMLPAADENDQFWEVEYREQLAGRALELIQTEFQPATWRAFWELVVAGRKGAEVAAELGLSVNAVYVARSRVLRRLRQELAGLMD